MDVVKLMLGRGVQLDESGAAIAAAKTGNLGILKLLLERGGSGLLEETEIWWMVTDRESIDSESTPLYRACRAGKKEVVKFLLGRGADGTSRDNIGTSCLDVAKAGGHHDVLKLLKE